MTILSEDDLNTAPERGAPTRGRPSAGWVPGQNGRQKLANASPYLFYIVRGLRAFSGRLVS